MFTRLSPVNFQSLEEVVAAAQQIDDGEQGETCQVDFVANASNETIAICHYLNMAGNFGDELGPAVVKRLMQLAARDPACTLSPSMETLNLAKDFKKREEGRFSKPYTCLFPLGSVFHKVKNDDHVWGIGINPTRQKKFPYPKRFHNHGVRGEKTLSLIRENVASMQSSDASTIPFGDPGFLIPFLFAEYWKASEPVRLKEKYGERRVCFIPHAHDLSRTYFELVGRNDTRTITQNAVASNGILLISVRQPWKLVLDAISRQCSHVASSSLHGIVEADAMGIPSLWFQWQDSETSLTEGVFKYLDYYSSIPATRRFEGPVLTDLSQITQLSAYPPPMTQEEIWEVVQTTLQSFPYDLFQVSGGPSGTGAATDSWTSEELLAVTQGSFPELNYHFGWFAITFLVLSQFVLRKYYRSLVKRRQR